MHNMWIWNKYSCFNPKGKNINFQKYLLRHENFYLGILLFSSSWLGIYYFTLPILQEIMLSMKDIKTLEYTLKPLNGFIPPEMKQITMNWSILHLQTQLLIIQ